MNAKAEEFNQRQRERRARTCEHFNGTQHDRCNAGVNYDQFRTWPGPYAFPCLPPFRDEQAQPTTCPQFKARGMEQVLKDDEEHAKLFLRINTARTAIVKHAGGKRGVAGRIQCPVCTTGTLGFTIAGCNGHIHAKCSTADCVAWME